jgi:putative transposase
MENFFGILKTEFFHGKKFESVEAFKTGLDEYMRYSTMIESRKN